MAQHWTARDIPDQAGRRVILTGANSGIGYSAALELARKNANVVLAVRDVSKGHTALQRILAEVAGANVTVAELDLASLRSVREFAQRENGNGLPLHVLINNAGVMAPKPRQVTEDGLEVQFGTNVAGHFALTGLLLPKLLSQATQAAPGGAPPRVVTVASIAHLTGKLHFDDLQFAAKYDAWAGYQQSKLADLMFALELDRRLRAQDPAASTGRPKVLSAACHPGVAQTNLFQTGKHGAVEVAVRKWMARLIGAVLNSEAQGAEPTLFAATSPEAESGGYYGPRGFREMRGPLGTARISSAAQNRDAARRLWTVCEELTGVAFLD